MIGSQMACIFQILIQFLCILSWSLNLENWKRKEKKNYYYQQKQKQKKTLTEEKKNWLCQYLQYS